MLNKRQQKVVFESEGNTIVGASPGTGKTRTLIARAQYRLESIPKHQHLALITYTNAGADEISSRLIADKKNIFIGTIHRFCLEFILRPFGWIYSWDKPRVVTYHERKEFLSLNEDIDLGQSPIDELNKIKRRLDGKLDNSVSWGNGRTLEYVADLYFDFLKAKKAIDFNDILYRSYKIISENDFVVTSLASRFYEILVDEFQDTNIFQYEILKIINSNNRSTFFLVGDEKQKIYRFAGAIQNAFQRASEDFNAPVKELNVTYRSTKNIIDAYSTLFQNHPRLENGSDYKDLDCKLAIRETDRDTNNQTIENFINYLTQKVNLPLSEIAVLTTSWPDAFNISRHLRKKYHVVGLGALPHRSVSSSTFSLLKSIAKFLYVPKVQNLRIIKRNVEFHALENNLMVSEEDIVYLTNSAISTAKGIDQNQTLIEGLNQIKTLFGSIFGFSHSSFDDLASRIEPEEATLWTIGKYLKTLSGVEGITVNTIHQSKGLEYHSVILNGVNEGRIPYQFWDRTTKKRGALTGEALEDGRTLLYVGMSRAKVGLILLHGWKPSLFIPRIRKSNA